MPANLYPGLALSLTEHILITNCHHVINSHTTFRNAIFRKAFRFVFFKISYDSRWYYLSSLNSILQRTSKGDNCFCLLCFKAHVHTRRLCLDCADAQVCQILAGLLSSKYRNLMKVFIFMVIKTNNKACFTITNGTLMTIRDYGA